MKTSSNRFNRVMIIDDTQIDRYIAKHILVKYDFSNELVEFDMATKAMAYLHQIKDQPELWPELILLDIRMPEMDGFQFLEKFSELYSAYKINCDVVILSSSLDPKDHERAEKFKQIKKFINKPINKIHLEEILTTCTRVSGN